ncbi:hypothetical protein GQ53DRAFT_764152 [Thozetella sp. PMI_491]|nr:hypothetical protein GQ53DRAFT_764152 [Thozetella sp. PMI_491]
MREIIDIQNWIDSLASLQPCDFEIELVRQAESATASSSHGTKRRRDGARQHPLSPPDSPPTEFVEMSESATPGQPQPKRRRTGQATVGRFDSPERAGVMRGETEDEESMITPRAARNTAFSAAVSHAASESGRSSVSGSSRASGRSSPRKRIAALEVKDDGLESRQLDLSNPSLPAPLAAFVKEMSRCETGYHVLSPADKDSIERRALRDPSFEFHDFMYADSPSARDSIGSAPTVETVTSILQSAKRCQEKEQAESGWNMLVHCPLLCAAINGPEESSGGVEQRRLAGVEPCTTAAVMSEYLLSDMTTKSVDFSLFLDPSLDSDPAAQEAVRAIRRRLPGNVVNHTEFPPFRNTPLTVSVETKKRKASDTQEAQLQIGIWHMAHWRLLERLAAQAGGSLDGLPFLPGIVVDGHNWEFVATTRNHQKTILWQERRFGATSDPLGVYRAFWGIQRLAAWTENVYWPWFKANALGLSQEDTGG